ncbi:hypothetical protein H9X85_10915 [Anaerotignum lactatifermentans]|uniref:Uncharacterized protein n=1 Tax=Anaerotignum lactatifermentans TaxID=160404 RepID=A0ABS2GDS5_9FIRM|nr:hypothetical protein [Anaerotignum lactatifermentans]MBM6830124.1 hypothetical protein [Anaerotignum lactatifermentans]MBM6878644.1 hypothetical protein [Anaerotignum lactatifermentans]MBM6951709.1 hypothetical protein [Anaerotignum lactatifermentans]
MWESIMTTGWKQILFCAIVAYVVWALVEKWIAFAKSRKNRRTFGEVDMMRVMERCREMFPIETVSFHGDLFQRGTRVRIVTTQENIIEGELVGMNRIQMVCIRTQTQIIAHQLNKIQDMRRI